MKPQKSLRARALDILSRQETSRAALKRKLAPHAENEAELEQLLDELAERGWQSDERYAETYIHSKSGRHGALRLKQALALQGIGEDISAHYLPERNSEHLTAAAVLRKKFKAPAADAKEKQKQMRFLLYRGFDTETALYAMKTAWEEDTDSNGL
ncbi:recombination regulator RecX [Neisseria sp.]|uniref:recombination regulator RecX n=1 Tax=Neisseria sp. TaxID=192066 RepID=UPI00359F7C0E